MTVVDTTAPQISGVPSAISKITDSDSGEAINFPLPIAYDMVDGDIAVSVVERSRLDLPARQNGRDFHRAQTWPETFRKRPWKSR